MTVLEALELLESAPYDDQPSKLNPILTRRQAVDIVRNGIKAHYEKTSQTILPDIFEKRVYQVVRDQSCPRY